MDKVKTCPSCKRSLPIEDFYDPPIYCKPCKRALTKKYRATPLGKKRKKKLNKTYRATKPGYKKSQARYNKSQKGLKTRKTARQRYRQTAKGKARVFLWDRRTHLKSSYSMTLEDYDAMYKAQNGLCAICNKNKKLGVDHDHKTGAIRELLCQTCNHMLGLAYENKKTLSNAVAYLRKHDIKSKGCIIGATKNVLPERVRAIEGGRS